MFVTCDWSAIGPCGRAFVDLRRARVALAWAMLVLVAVGCDQKDPDADPEPEQDGGRPEPGEVDAATYLELAVRDNPYPMVDGASWVYRHRGGDTTWDEQVTLAAERFQGQDAFLLADSEGPSGSRSESILAQQGSAATRVHKEVLFGERIDATVDYDPGFLRFDLAWLDVDEGFSEEREYHRVELDATGNVARDGDRAHAFTIESLDDSVSAPIGDIDGCIRVYRERVRNTGAMTSEDDNKRFWFCPGLGKVREEDDAGKVEELVECDIPGGRCP